jgi:hypothetical protein
MPANERLAAILNHPRDIQMGFRTLHGERGREMVALSESSFKFFCSSRRRPIALSGGSQKLRFFLLLSQVQKSHKPKLTSPQHPLKFEVSRIGVPS